MKKSTTLIVLILALVFAVGLCACGGSKGTDAGKTEDQNKQTEQGDAQYQKDKTTLENAGYTVSLYTNATSLKPFESANGMETGSLDAYLGAMKADAAPMTVFYFKSAEAASAFQAQEEGSVLKGKAVILNDTDELLSK